MAAKTVTAINFKGGAGKTLTTMALGGELGARGYRVLVCDVDPQQTSVLWAQAASDAAQFPVTAIGMSSYADKLHREIQKQLEHWDYILIDCAPGMDCLTTQSALLVSDLAIVPLQPSPADLWAARGVKDLIIRLQGINEGLQAVILPNRVQRTSLSKALIAELDNFGVPVMKSRLTNRIAYQEAVLSGSTIGAMGRDAKQAADEVKALTDEILTILGDAK